jgi:hypothetical protein
VHYREYAMENGVTAEARPYQQRRAFATCRRIWPEVDVVCAADPLTLDDYVRRFRPAGACGVHQPIPVKGRDHGRSDSCPGKDRPC